ncbi:hypothetical protein LTR53_014730, partial [Teratosphaeriaceae sp. CCFEE 6253]
MARSGKPKRDSGRQQYEDSDDDNNTSEKVKREQTVVVQKASTGALELVMCYLPCLPADQTKSLSSHGTASSPDSRPHPRAGTGNHYVSVDGVTLTLASPTHILLSSHGTASSPDSRPHPAAIGPAQAITPPPVDG